MPTIVSQSSPPSSPAGYYDPSQSAALGSSVVSPHRVTLHEESRPSSASRRSLYRVRSFATQASSAIGRRLSKRSGGSSSEEADEEEEEEDGDDRKPETPQARAMRAAVSSIALTIELLRLTLGGGLISLEVSAAGGSPDVGGLLLFSLTLTFSAFSASALAAGIGQPQASRHHRVALRFASKLFFFFTFISLLELIALIVVSATEHEGYWQYYTSATSSTSSVASGLKSLLPLAWPLATLAFLARLEVAIIAWRGQVLFLALDDEDKSHSFRFKDASQRQFEPVGGYAKRTMSAARPSEASVLRGSQPLRGHVSIAESIQASEASGAVSNFSPLPVPDSGYGMTLPSPPPVHFQFQQPQSPGFGKTEDAADFGHVKSSMKLNNMSHAQLHSDERLRQAFERKVKEALLKESGHAALGEDHIHLALRPGSVIVEATITPPPGVSHHNVHTRLESSASLSQTVLNHIHQVDGIDRVKEGAVHVSDVSHSKHTYASPLTTSAELEMSGPMSPQSPAGSSFYGASRRHNVHDRCASGASALLSVKQLETSFREELRRQKEEWQKALADVRATCERHARLAESHSERIDDAMRQARMPRPPALSSSELRANVDGAAADSRGLAPSAHQWGPRQDEIIQQRTEGGAGGPEDSANSESLAAKVAQRVAFAALRSGEGGGVEGRLRTLQREVQSLAAELSEARASAASLRDRRIDREGWRLQHDLVEALVLPVDERSSAQRLALRLLRQATEVSALVLAGAQSTSRASNDLVEELRSKYRSMRELREVFKQIMADRVQHVLGKSGKAAQAAVSTALRGSDSRGRPFGRQAAEGRDIIALGSSVRSGFSGSGAESPPVQDQALRGTLPAAPPESEFDAGGLVAPSVSVFPSASSTDRGRPRQRDDEAMALPRTSLSPALSFVPSEASIPFRVRPEHRRQQEEAARSISPARIWSNENTLEQQQGLLGEPHHEQRGRSGQHSNHGEPSPQHTSLQQQQQRQPQPVYPSQGPKSYENSDSSDSTSRSMPASGSRQPVRGAGNGNSNGSGNGSGSGNTSSSSNTFNNFSSNDRQQQQQRQQQPQQQHDEEDPTASLRGSPPRSVPNEWQWRSQLQQQPPPPQPSQVVQMVGALEGGRTAPPRLLSQHFGLEAQLGRQTRQTTLPLSQERDNLWQQQQHPQRLPYPYSPGATLPFDAAGW